MSLDWRMTLAAALAKVGRIARPRSRPHVYHAAAAVCASRAPPPIALNVLDEDLRYASEIRLPARSIHSFAPLYWFKLQRTSAAIGLSLTS
jgi:hypothetical protein